MHVETKESWSSSLIARFNEVSQKFDSDGQINELKSASNAPKQEQLLKEDSMNPKIYEYHPSKISTNCIYETEYQNVENSTKRQSCEIEILKRKCIAETTDGNKSYSGETILPSNYLDVSMRRKGRLFDGFSIHRGNVFPLVSCVKINTPLIQEWGCRGTLIRGRVISHSTTECCIKNTHIYWGIKLKHLADMMQDFEEKKGIRYLPCDRDNTKSEAEKEKFQENPIPEATPVDFLVADIKNSIKISEFIDKEEQLSKDIKEFQVKTEKMNDKYEKYDKMMGDAAELSQKFKERLKQSRKISEKVSDALSDKLY